ncbi:hypothetical protein D3C78_664930 [compost metagenome]
MTIFFLGWTAQYEQRMVHHLAASHDVKMLVAPKWMKRVGRYLNSFSKGRNRPTRGHHWLADQLMKPHKVKHDDILICNEGQFRRGLNPAIVERFKGHKVLMVRDLVTASFIDALRPRFDKLYSFDKAQCDALGLDYLNQFFPFGFDEALRLAEQSGDNRTAPACFFLGRDKGRTALVESVAQVLEKNGCQVDFHLVPDSTSLPASRFYIDDVLPYAENIRRSMAADILLEINQPGQAGITLRTLEAAYFNKRLITNNASVKTLDIYRPENIYVIEDNDFSGLADFLGGQPVRLNHEALYGYSPEAMIQHVIQDMRPTHSHNA